MCFAIHLARFSLIQKHDCKIFWTKKKLTAKRKNILHLHFKLVLNYCRNSYEREKKSSNFHFHKFKFQFKLKEKSNPSHSHFHILHLHSSSSSWRETKYSQYISFNSTSIQNSSRNFKSSHFQLPDCLRGRHPTILPSRTIRGLNLILKIMMVIINPPWISTWNSGTPADFADR